MFRIILFEVFKIRWKFNKAAGMWTVVSEAVDEIQFDQRHCASCTDTNYMESTNPRENVFVANT